MFFQSFQITGAAVLQSFFLGAIGYYLVKKEVLGSACLGTLSRLVIEVTLPFLIFSQLIKDFSFTRYPEWWIFPLVSIAITLAGLLAGLVFSGFIAGQQKKLQFLSLVSFQNSGFLPLAIIAALLPKDKMDPMFIYLFLFLLGFNLVMFSLGVYMLTFARDRRFELTGLFNPPVVATLIGLALVFFGIHRFIPEFIVKPLRMTGDCTLPLAMFVVGGSLAQIRLEHVDVKAMLLLAISKLVLLPLAGLWLLKLVPLPELIGLLIVMQLAVPSATTLSVITTHYKKEDLIVSQGIFWTHMVSIVTIPVFLSLYFTFIVLK
jgi:predicted permease